MVPTAEMFWAATDNSNNSNGHAVGNLRRNCQRAADAYVQILFGDMHRVIETRVLRGSSAFCSLPV